MSPYSSSVRNSGSFIAMGKVYHKSARRRGTRPSLPRQIACPDDCGLGRFSWWAGSRALSAGPLLARTMLFIDPTYRRAYIQISMRRCLAGIFILFIAPVVAFAQVRGEVESVGFQNRCRPDCWTPMTVKLIPETGKTDFYQIQVKQEDLDRDRAVFTRTVSVTGNAEGQS